MNSNSPAQTETPKGTETFLALSILDSQVQETREALKPLRIPVRKEKQESSEFRPYLTTLYNAPDLTNINILVFYPELLEDANVLGEEDFKERVRSGLKEEAIHCLQLLSTKNQFQKMSPELQTRFKSPNHYWKKMQQHLFAELARKPEGEKLLLASAQLYYEDPSITTLKVLMRADRKRHHRIGYTTVELVRQLIEVRLGEQTSEEARKETWDKKGWWKSQTHQSQVQSILETIRAAAPNPGDISPMLAEIIDDTHKLYQRVQNLFPSPEVKPKRKQDFQPSI